MIDRVRLTLWFLLLMPFVVFSQWGLSGIEKSEVIPKNIPRELYCSKIYDDSHLIECDSLEVVINFCQDPSLVIFYSEFLPISRILIGYRQVERRRYICIETYTWTFLVQDTIVDGFRFMQAISNEGKTIKYLLKN